MDAALLQADDHSADRIDELLSLFFDDCLSESDLAELNEVLLGDPAARDRCIEAAQLHADLLSIFASESTKPAVAELDALLAAVEPNATV
ncbi:MAG: hypothetical protein AAF805_00510 [Planctomycetota bacterium]